MIVLFTVLAAAAVLLVYEFFALVTGRKLVTTMVREAYAFYPPLGFIVGLLSGLLLAHFFWQ